LLSFEYLSVRRSIDRGVARLGLERDTIGSVSVGGIDLLHSI
jgi:hypothetical protein